MKYLPNAFAFIYVIDVSNAGGLQENFRGKVSGAYLGTSTLVINLENRIKPLGTFSPLDLDWGHLERGEALNTRCRARNTCMQQPLALVTKELLK